MKKWLIVLLVVSCASVGHAQTNEPTISDAIRFGQWLLENTDWSAFSVDDLDTDALDGLCRAVQQRLQDDSVWDVGAIRQAAVALLPAVEQNSELKSYAPWLRARIDELEVAEQLQKLSPSPPAGQRPVNPSPKIQRRVWEERAAKRPAVPTKTMQLVSRLKPVFAANGVPTELVWMAEVESSFDARARSPAGAVGLFQLMPATAAARGLRTWPFDERTEPEKSARATAEYLRYLHGRFDDWRLVFAAYNAGETRVRTLLNRRRAKTFDEIAIFLPAETQLYVPKIEATIRRREGAALTSLSVTGSSRGER